MTRNTCYLLLLLLLSPSTLAHGTVDLGLLIERTSGNTSIGL
jgi:hypothetical protein